MRADERCVTAPSVCVARSLQVSGLVPHQAEDAGRVEQEGAQREAGRVSVRDPGESCERGVGLSVRAVLRLKTQ